MTDAPSGGPSGGASPSAGASPSGGMAGAAADWPEKAVGAVDLVVDTIHDKALRPILLAARAVVFGLLAAVLALVVLVLLSVGLVRLLDVYAFNGRVWISYAVIGGVFCLGGLLAWTKRAPRAAGTSRD